MSKVVTIRLTKTGSTVGPFTLTTEYDDIVATGVSKKSLILGMSYSIDDRVNFIIIESTGKCKIRRVFPVEVLSIYQYRDVT